MISLLLQLFKSFTKHRGAAHPDFAVLLTYHTPKHFSIMFADHFHQTKKDARFGHPFSFLRFVLCKQIKRNKQYSCQNHKHREYVSDFTAHARQLCVVPTVPCACKSKHESRCKSAPYAFIYARAFGNEDNRNDAEQRRKNKHIRDYLIDNAF